MHIEVDSLHWGTIKRVGGSPLEGKTYAKVVMIAFDDRLSTETADVNFFLHRENSLVAFDLICFYVLVCFRI